MEKRQKGRANSFKERGWVGNKLLKMEQLMIASCKKMLITNKKKVILC